MPGTLLSALKYSLSVSYYCANAAGITISPNLQMRKQRQEQMNGCAKGAKVASGKPRIVTMKLRTRLCLSVENRRAPSMEQYGFRKFILQSVWARM